MKEINNIEIINKRLKENEKMYQNVLIDYETYKSIKEELLSKLKGFF